MTKPIQNNEKLAESVGESSLAALGEFGLIERLARFLPGRGEDTQIGIGDDAAVYRLGDRTLLATTDALLEGVHFRRDWTSPEDLGWKALAVNLSDIAAMGGRPSFALISLGLPPGTPVEWTEGLYRGLAEIAMRYRCPILGGDTVASPDRIYLNLTVVGETPSGDYATRSGAKPGDLLMVTGTLGDSVAGYLCLKAGLHLPERGESLTPAQLEAVQICIKAHRRPVPRLDVAEAVMRTHGIHAMLDLSDGLSGDVRHLARRSGVGIRLEENRLPISESLRQVALLLGKSPTELALMGGEDYELLMAVPPTHSEVVQQVGLASEITITPIGEVTDPVGEITYVRSSGKEIPLPQTSWDHFSTPPD